MSDTTGSSSSISVVRVVGRAIEVIGAVEVEGIASSDLLARRVVPSSSSQFDAVVADRAGKMLATLKPLSAAVNSLALGLYLCPPLPRIKENRFLKNKKAGGHRDAGSHMKWGVLYVIG